MKRPTHPPRDRGRHASPRAADGFTLIELLMAMFILSVGLVAIASIFPVSSYLQKQTFEDTITLQVKRNAEAVLYEMPVPPQSGSGIQAVSGLDSEYPLSVRCYPLMLDSDNDGVDDGAHGERDFYWVPVVEDNEGSRRVFVFILSRKDDVTYETGWASVDDVANANDAATVPKVVSLAYTSRQIITTEDGDTYTLMTISKNEVDDRPLIQPGDQLLSSDGRILRVRDFDENRDEPVITKLRLAGNLSSLPGSGSVWFGLRGKDDRTSPTRRIIVLGEEAVQ